METNFTTKDHTGVIKCEKQGAFRTRVMSDRGRPAEVEVD